ncbi:OB-fold protein [Novosphingobium sp.]|uniref:OB-fold protein n=1 Tax=Novosphingobium sp. TaxID=1874826 RepID=UPI0038BC4550
MTNKLYPGQQPPGWTPPPGTEKKKLGCGMIALIIVGGIFGLGVIGSMIPDADKGAGGAAGEAGAAVASAPPVSVTSAELARAYDENEVAAQQKYQDKVLLVSGRVESIELDLTNDPVIHLDGLNEYQPVSVHLEKDASAQASALKKGQHLGVQCVKVGEVMGYPQLSDCVIAAVQP